MLWSWLWTLPYIFALTSMSLRDDHNITQWVVQACHCLLSQLRTHLLGVYVANEDCLHCYLYDDTIAGAGPNEVISLLHCTLMKLTEQYGTFDHLIVWTDNAPSQFKECFFFFYLDHLVQNKYFLRIDLKFLLEGHSYSTCDRRFACMHTTVLWYSGKSRSATRMGYTFEKHWLKKH